MDFIFQALAGLLSFYYELLPNYAVAIALLTVTVMLLLFPLNAKGMRSMAAMSKLSPEMKRIQAKHKNDKVKQNEEMMALFKEHKVTPFGGCLPLLLQMPVLFIMYRVIRGLVYTTPEGTFDPKYISHSSSLYQSLVGQTEMKAFGMDLAKSAKEVLQISLVVAIPFLILIVLVVAAGYFQQAMISRRNPQQASADDNPMQKQMQQMTKVMPLMYLVFGFTLPAGLNIYFLVSSIFRIGQQTLIYKLDPSLAPGHGARTIASRDVDKDKGAEKDKSKPEKDKKAEARPSTASNGKGNGAGGARPAPATASGPAPARIANRPANKKKKRR